MASNSMGRILMLLAILWFAMFSQIFAQNCPTTYSNKLYAKCNDLSALQSKLAWTYHPQNGTVDVVFRAAPAASAGWVGWGINPTGSRMIGTQAFIAFKNSSNGGQPYVFAYDIQSKGSPPSPGKISISYSNLTAQYESASGDLIIFASLTLPSNKTTVNHCWNVGSSVDGNKPSAHAYNTANLASLGSIDLATGAGSSSSGAPRLKLKNRHGVINAVGWGILMPVGAIIARYVKMFEAADPAWFYLHVFCQMSGYALGVAGWGTGLKLGSDSPGVKYTAHRNIGMALFVFGTLQISALLLRPKKDHKFRIYWKAYHLTVGYCIIILAIINIFKGLDILDPADKWRHAYIAVIACLGAIALILEIVTWIIYFRRQSEEGSKSANSTATNGMGGHGYRPSHV